LMKSALGQSGHSPTIRPMSALRQKRHSCGCITAIRIGLHQVRQSRPTYPSARCGVRSGARAIAVGIPPPGGRNRYEGFEISTVGRTR
jgi:hypothetical protein